MIVPISLIAQTESMLFTPEDVILALDRWVLPNYKNLSTNHAANTRLECMGVLNSFYQAGKFHMSLKPSEIEEAVNVFMEDRLWVSRDTMKGLVLLPNQRPETWMIKPTLRAVACAIPKVLFEAAYVIYNLISASVTYTWYASKAPRSVKVPNPTERASSTLTLVKKDS